MSSHANAWKNGIKNNKQNLFVLWISLIVALLCVFTQGPETNPDIWFLLSVGRNILKNGFATTDTLLMHENVHAIAQQWLSSIVFYKIYSVSGFFGLIALRNIFFLLWVCLIYLFAKPYCKNSAMLLCITVCSSAFLSYFLSIRPYLFCFPAFLAEIFLTEKFFRNNSPKYLIPLPFLSVFLINIQGAMWPMFFVFLMPFIAETVLNKIFKTKTFQIYKYKINITELNTRLYPLLIAAALSFATGFINPYGAEMMLYGIKSIAIPELKYVGEMNTVIVTVSMPILVLFSMCIIVFFGRFRKCPDKKDGSPSGVSEATFSLRYVFLMAGTALMSFMSGRNLILFTAAFSLCFTDVPAFGKDLNFNFSDRRKNILKNIVLCVLSGLLLFSFCVTTYKADTSFEDNDMIDYIMENESDFQGKTVLTINNGGYAAFYGMRPYMDTRMEIGCKALNGKYDYLKEYAINMVKWKGLSKEENAQCNPGAFMQKYHFDYVLTYDYTCGSFSEYMENSDEFEEIYRRDEKHRIYKYIND